MDVQVRRGCRRLARHPDLALTQIACDGGLHGLEKPAVGRGSRQRGPQMIAGEGLHRQPCDPVGDFQGKQGWPPQRQRAQEMIKPSEPAGQDAPEHQAADDSQRFAECITAAITRRGEMARFVADAQADPGVGQETAVDVAIEA